MTEPLLRVRLEAGYGDKNVLEDIQLDLGMGDRTGLVGTSGAGKSTLVLALLGLLPWRGGWAKGEVVLEGHDLLSLKERDARRLRGCRVALVPQSPMSALNASLSLRRHFEEAWKAHEDKAPEKLRSRLKQLMRQVQLPHEESFLARRPGEVSVGEAQRTVIALALLHRPALLIADEPTSALDPNTQVEILDLLRRVNFEDGTALLYISHDLLSVLQLCERIAVLHHRRIVECIPVDRIEESACHPATLALLRTLPVPPHVLREYFKTAGCSKVPSLQ